MGVKTWFMILREERRLVVYKNRLARGMFGPKWYEIIGDRRKLHNCN
jgi:hypothetical protein